MNRSFNPARRRIKARPFRWTKSKYPSKVDSIIGHSLSFPGIGSKIREYKIRKAWPEAVGSAISKKAAPDKLIGNTLYCNVSTAPWMTELNYQKRSIIEKLNAKVASGAIIEIIFKHGHVTEPKGPPERVERKRRVLGAEELKHDREAAPADKGPGASARCKEGYHYGEVLGLALSSGHARIT